MISEKPHISIAFIGPCGTGKSILVNQLLKNLRILKSEKVIEKKEDLLSSVFEKNYFNYNRRRNNEDTYHVNYTLHQLETEKYRFTFIDTRGSRNYKKKVIAGIALADYAILVANACPTQVYSKINFYGSNTFYSLLAYLLGAKQNIACVNQIDRLTLSSSQSEFENIKLDLTKRLKRIDSSLESILLIPTSGFRNFNLINSSPELDWYKGPNLLEALLNLNEPKRNIEKPLRMIVSQIFKVRGSGTIIGGRIVSGTLRIGQAVTIAPSGVTGIVKSIEIFKENIEVAYAGDLVGLRVTNINSSVKKGSVVSDKLNDPARECESFSAEIYIVSHPGKIRVGYMPVFNIHSARLTCRFEALQRIFDSKTGAVLEENPEYLKSKDSALVVMVPFKPLCVEAYADYPKLGRFVVSDLDRVVAVGKIREVLKK